MQEQNVMNTNASKKGGMKWIILGVVLAVGAVLAVAVVGIGIGIYIYTKPSAYPERTFDKPNFVPTTPTDASNGKDVKKTETLLLFIGEKAKFGEYIKMSLVSNSANSLLSRSIAEVKGTYRSSKNVTTSLIVADYTNKEAAKSDLETLYASKVGGRQVMLKLEETNNYISGMYKDNNGYSYTSCSWTKEGLALCRVFIADDVTTLKNFKQAVESAFKKK